MNLSELNDSQRQAVEYIDGPGLVIAGAGSGKTRVLTYKIAYLLERGMQPWNILALTFTNKAAREMRERIGKLVGEDLASSLWMGTFHSVFARILRMESQYIGFQPDFTIYDQQDSRSLVKTIVKEMGLDDKTYKAAGVAARISMAKNRLIGPRQYVQDRAFMESDQFNNQPRLCDIYQEYVQRCRQSGAMDFDDLLVYTYMLFFQYPDVLKKYVDRFRFVLVDEYQDTNFAQHQIVWMLTQHRQMLCVVGDDAQSIYSFRGANIDNILHFQERYRDVHLFKLEQNYRSTQNIVTAANSLIHHNQGQIHKDVFSRNDVGEPVTLMETYSDIDEATTVTRCIRELRSMDNVPYSQIAVLYRTNAQSRPFEEALRKSSIPYIIYGGTSFYQRKEIKDVIAYLRLTVNPHDEEALRRIINYPARGIGQSTLDKVFQTAHEHNMSPWDVLKADGLVPVNNGIRAKLNNFVQLIESFHLSHSTTDAHQLALDIVRRSGVQTEINTGHEPEDISRQENLQELMDAIAAFVSERNEAGQKAFVTDYLQEVSLLSDMDQNDAAGEDRITLMTIHSAKGLEFRAVFVVGLEEGLFPSDMCMDHPRALEEERRLFYVAMTRAKEFLYLSNAKSRLRYGKTEFSDPSRFISEIDQRYIRRGGGRRSAANSSIFSIKGQGSGYGQKTSANPFGSSVPTGADARRFVRLKPTTTAPKSSRPVQPHASNPSNFSNHSNASDNSVCVGCRVMHERFGQGTVKAIDGTGMDAKATVLFDSVGQKQLLLRFAKIKVM